MWIGIAVQHQDACSVAGQRLHSGQGYRYYVLVHSIRRWSDLDPNCKLFYSKSEEENGGLGDKISLVKGPEGRQEMRRQGEAKIWGVRERG